MLRRTWGYPVPDADSADPVWYLSTGRYVGEGRKWGQSDPAVRELVTIFRARRESGLSTTYDDLAAALSPTALDWLTLRWAVTKMAVEQFLFAAGVWPIRRTAWKKRRREWIRMEPWIRRRVGAFRPSIEDDDPPAIG
jgi:hypothetical protein